MNDLIEFKKHSETELIFDFEEDEKEWLMRCLSILHSKSERLIENTQ